MSGEMFYRCAGSIQDEFVTHEGIYLQNVCSSHYFSLSLFHFSSVITVVCDLLLSFRNCFIASTHAPELPLVGKLNKLFSLAFEAFLWKAAQELDILIEPTTHFLELSDHS
jgi:hypothetical protein